MRHARTTAGAGGDRWGLPSAGARHLGAAGRPGWLRSSAMAAAFVVPIVISLVLLVTAGPARLSTRATAGAKEGDGAKLVAASVRAGDSNRLATLINQERVRHGLAPLAVSPRLNALAAAHSVEMATQQRLWAEPEPGAGALGGLPLAEHVECAASVEQAFERLLRAPEKRASMLEPSVNAVGLGTAGGRCLWVTAMFAKVPAKQQTGAARPTPVAPRGTGSAAPATPTTRSSPPTTAQAAAPRPSSTAEAIAKDLFGRANAERAARGLPALAWSDDLAKLASDWSSHMAATGGFAHRDLGAARNQPGISKFSALGENIAWVAGYQNDAFQLHTGWMKSDGHRENLLQPGFDSVGIGVVCSGGKAWATQNFGRASASTPNLSSTVPSQDPITAVELDGLVC